MIRFMEDWARYPNAIPDFQTRNKTALELAYKLKKMGIKNYLFFLALHNPELQGVDPHSPDLTIKQMTDISVECRINPWYFFREVARAPAQAGSESKPIQFNRSNVSLWWCFFNHIFFILTQPRQTGKSFNTDMLMTELMNFYCNNSQINLMTKDDMLRRTNIDRLKNIYDELPDYLKLKTRNDTNNTEEITIKAMGNVYKTHVPQASEKNAYKLGRGLTTPIFQIDEGPFQPNIKIAMGSALMAMGAAIDNAKANGEPYGVIMTTTAGKIDDKDGAYVYSLIQKAAVWTERFYDALNEVELEKMVRRHSPNGEYRIYACFSYKQLGKSDAWAKEQLERAGLDGDDANRDLFNIWTSGSSSSPIPTIYLQAMAKSVLDPEHEQIFKIGSYMLRWYVPEDELMTFLANRKVIVGLDTSDASGGDDIAMVLVDVETGGVVGAGNFNETNLITFSQWLVYLIMTFENMTFNIERRSSGITIIDYLLLQLPELGIDPFERLFNWVMNDPHEHPERYKEACMPMSRRPLDTYTRAKKYFGFATSGAGQTSRTELYSTTLMEAAKFCSNRLHDRPLVNQISGLVKKNGRVDHADGSHDDLVIAWLLTHWILTKAKNVQAYGVETRKILSFKEEKEAVSTQEYAQNALQQRIRDRIDAIAELLTNENDSFLVARYENELKYLDTQLILKDGENFSLAKFLDDLRESKNSAKNYARNNYIQDIPDTPAGVLMRRYIPENVTVF